MNNFRILILALLLLLLGQNVHAKAILEVQYSRQKLLPFFEVLKPGLASSNALLKQKQEFQEATGIDPERVKALSKAFLVLPPKRIPITLVLEAIAKFQSLPAQIIEARLQESFDPVIQKMGYLIRLRLLQKSQLQPVIEALVLFSPQGRPLALGSNLSQMLLSMEPYVYLNSYFVWQAETFKGMRERVEILVYKNGTWVNSIRPVYDPIRLEEGVPVPPYLTFEKIPNHPYALIAGGILYESKFTPIQPPLGKTFPQYAVAATGNMLVFRSAETGTNQEHWYKFLNLKTGKVFQPEFELQTQGYEINIPKTYETEDFLIGGVVRYYVQTPKPEDWTNAESRSMTELRKAFLPAIKKHLNHESVQISKVELQEDKNKIPDLEISYSPASTGIQKTVQTLNTEKIKSHSLFYRVGVSIRSGFLNTRNQTVYIKENYAPTYNVEVLD